MGGLLRADALLGRVLGLTTGRCRSCCSQRPASGRASATKTGLVETTEKLIRKAQRTGQMRKDVVVEDVPTIMCGLGSVIGAHEECMPALNWERFLALLLDGMRAPGGQKLPKPKVMIRRSRAAGG